MLAEGRRVVKESTQCRADDVSQDELRSDRIRVGSVKSDGLADVIEVKEVSVWAETRTNGSM